MKYFITFLLLFCSFLQAALFAQEKADYTWLFGYNSSTTFEYDSFNIFGNSIIDFNAGIDTASRLEIGLDFDFCNTSISDENGDLLFYTNGVEIGTKTHEIMENSEYLYDNSGGWPLRVMQGALILPYPDNDNKYVLLHCNKKYIETSETATLATLPLYYSIIDMELANGLGVVSEKKIVLKHDTLQFSKLTACRHANGRDWWIRSPRLFTSKMYNFLLTPDGFVEKEEQIFADTILNGPGQAVFSPDGTIFAYLSVYEIGSSEIQIFNFDRCTGELTFISKHFNIEASITGGLAISPNSRFLYHTAMYNVFQYDLWADDIQASKDTVAVYDGYREPIPGTSIDLPPLFMAAQLAPNGKIYVCSSNGIRALHIIHNPNEKGLACNFEQRAMMLPNLNYSMPTFPNYRLGALEGSACDTITVGVDDANRLPKVNIAMWPNPAREQLNLKIEGFEGASTEKIAIIIRDALGNEVKRHRQINSINDEGSFILNIRLGALPVGIYFCEGRWMGRAIFLRKFVVI